MVMLAWVCAGLSFWAAVAVLSVAALAHALAALHKARRHHSGFGPHVGQVAR